MVYEQKWSSENTDSHICSENTDWSSPTSMMYDTMKDEWHANVCGIYLGFVMLCKLYFVLDNLCAGSTNFEKHKGKVRMGKEKEIENKVKKKLSVKWERKNR